jgi:precorrin-6Y C5,15-methyltransferase (decarboxylating)
MADLIETDAVKSMESSNATPGRWLSIVGIGEDGREGLSPAANRLIGDAALVVGGERHLALAGAIAGAKLTWRSPFRATLPRILERRGTPVCVLASGDPFWFGAGVVLAEHLPAAEMVVLPAPSTFSLAAAKLGWSIQNTVTLGLHVRPVESVLRYLHHRQRILALSLDGSAPAQLARLLCEYGFGMSILTVMEALGGPRERIYKGSATEFVSRSFSALNIMGIEVKAGPGARAIPFAAGLTDSYFEHDGQITKREIRAITLSALRPAPGELLWDVGLGSGSVAIEWMLSHSSTKAIGFERSAERAARAARNAAVLGVPHLEIREGSAPEILKDAPAPDAVFVGGGVSERGILAACWEALKPQGRIVCNAVTFAGQAALMKCRASWGGALTRISIEREHEVGKHTAWQPAMPVLQWAAVKA